MDAAVARKSAVLTVGWAQGNGIHPLVRAIEIGRIEESLEASTKQQSGRKRPNLFSSQEGERLVQETQAIGHCATPDQRRTVQQEAQRFDIGNMEPSANGPCLRRRGESRIEVADRKRDQALRKRDDAMLGAFGLVAQ